MNKIEEPKTAAEIILETKDQRNTTILRIVRDHLQILISSAKVYVDVDGDVVGYKINTGALHRLLGIFSALDLPISIPVNLEEVKQPPSRS